MTGSRGKAGQRVAETHLTGALRQRWPVWASNEVEFDEQAGQPDMPISYAVSVSVCVFV